MKSSVTITRRKWDLYFGIAGILFALVGSVLAYYGQNIRYLLFPLGLVPVWLFLRVSCPEEGMKTEAIRDYSPARRRCVWMNAVFFAVLVVTMLVESALGGEGWVTVGVGVAAVVVVSRAVVKADKERQQQAE